MTALTSKIQYRNFEEGEFTEEQERTFEETIQLIENFPWQQQREHFVVGLTAPSITIKNKEGDYLKLLLYYNQKFILHFFDSNHDHYTKNFLYLKDAYNDIHDFCTTSINRHEFKFEGRNAHIKKHFANKDFTYKLTLQNSLLQFFGNGGYNIFMSLFLLYITS